MRHTHRGPEGPYSYCYVCGERYSDDERCACVDTEEEQRMDEACVMCGEPVEDGTACVTCIQQELSEDDEYRLHLEEVEQADRDAYDNMISEWEG